jgi:Obg family GTPase CgtA-like protein
VRKVVDIEKNKITEAAVDNALPVLKLQNVDKAWKVVKEEKKFVITGHKIEKFAARTDYSNEQGLRRLRDIMLKMGITHELLRQGINAGDRVEIGRRSNTGSFEF